MKDAAMAKGHAVMKSSAAALITNQRAGVLLMILSALFASFGQLFYKLSASELDGTGSTLYLIIGLALYSAGGIVMMQAYKRGRLSILQPLLALANVFAVFIAVFILGEAVTPLRLLAVSAIVAGAVVLGGCDE